MLLDIPLMEHYNVLDAENGIPLGWARLALFMSYQNFLHVSFKSIQPFLLECNMQHCHRMTFPDQIDSILKLRGNKQDNIHI